MNHLHPFSNIQELQTGPGRGMSNFLNAIRIFRVCVANPKFVFKEGGQKPEENIAILINGSAEHGPPVIIIIGRVIRATAKKGNPKWGSSYDHKISDREIRPWIVGQAGFL